MEKIIKKIEAQNQIYDTSDTKYDPELLYKKLESKKRYEERKEIIEIQKQIEKLKEEIKTLEDKVEGLDKKGSDKNWRAKEGAGYWSLTYNGKTFNPVEEGDYVDDYHYNSLSYFKTEKEAEDYKKYLLAVGKVTRAIWEANGDWRPDWKNSNKKKHYIYWSFGYKALSISSCTYSFRLSNLPYIKDEETAEQIIKDYEQELKIIFDYQRDVIN